MEFPTSFDPIRKPKKITVFPGWRSDQGQMQRGSISHRFQGWRLQPQGRQDKNGPLFVCAISMPHTLLAPTLHGTMRPESLMDTELVFFAEEAPEGGTPEDLEANVRGAVRCHFDEKKLPKIIRLHFVRDQVIAV